MKAKTKRRIKHVLTKKKLVKKQTSRHVMRSFIIVLATICTGSLAYAIATTKPTITVGVRSGSPDGRTLSAPGTPVPTPSTPGQGNPDQSGRASWYALGLPAPDSLTCASRTFPRGSYLYVKNLRNGLTVTCRVNDYGPAIWTGRAIDLSRGSFREIDSLGSGTTSVQIWRVSGNPAGFTIPVIKDIGQIIGYNFCAKSHTAQYCEEHKQD